MNAVRALALTALVLGLLAPLAGSPFLPGEPVSAIDVASWLRDRRAVRIVDLRRTEEFERFHLPRAERRSATSFDSLAPAAGDTLVLYGTARQLRTARRALRGSGAAVYYLEDAVAAWLDGVINPVLPPGASAAEREAFGEVAELSRYFGGRPRTGAVLPDSLTLEQRMERTIRRGCAF